MTIAATSAQYVPASTSQVIRTGPGVLVDIIATTTSATAVTITFYDNSAASGAILLTLNLQADSPIHIHYPFFPLALRFSVGLAITTPAGTTCHVTIAY